jgi:hypothetical protein
VEDAPGEAVLRRVLAELAPDWAVALVHDCGGFGRIRARLDRYRNASHVYPHLLLTDLDARSCPVDLLEEWRVRSQPPRFLFRIAVREVEAWLMADRHGVAHWLQISLNKIPQVPEAEIDPKARLISLARGSRSQRLASEFCPAPGSKASQGPLYNARITEFVRGVWSLDAAREAAPSLERACHRILELARGPAPRPESGGREPAL